MHSAASFRDRIKRKGKQQQCNDAHHFSGSGAAISPATMHKHAHSQIPRGEALRRRLHVHCLYVCLAMHFCGSTRRRRWTRKGGKCCKRRKRPYTVGTQRERNVHIEGRYSESVSDRREQPPDTPGEKHVDIANNTANTQRNLRLTITTSAYDCTVRLEVTRVEATPRKTFSTQIGPPSAMLPLF